MWIEVKRPTPVLNTADFRFAFGGASGAAIPLNERGLPHCFEFVALPGCPFWVEAKIPSSPILRVSSPRYPAASLFLDARFAAPVQQPQLSLPSLPSREELLERMMALEGTPYIWGGNWSCGIPELLELYPPSAPLPEATRTLWTLCGVDCSGLLYEASRGATPRNTKELLSFGRALPIQGLSPEELLSFLEPLDMIVYLGHVLFVVEGGRVLESRFSCGGVVTTPLATRLLELFCEKKGADDPSFSDLRSTFFVRRFIA